MNVFPQRARETQFLGGSSPAASPDRDRGEGRARTLSQGSVPKQQQSASAGSEEAVKTTDKDAVPELDDFGLPIRKYQRKNDGIDGKKAMQLEKAEDTKLKGSREEEKNDDGPSMAERPPEAQSAETPKAPAPKADDPATDNDADSTSDGEEFTDAEEVPVNGASMTKGDMADEASESSAPTVTEKESSTTASGQNNAPDQPSKAATKTANADAVPKEDGEVREADPKTPTAPRPSTPPAQVAVVDLAQAEAAKDLDQSPIRQHTRDSSMTIPVVISEFSHQQLATRKADGDGTAEESDWQVMPAFAPYKIYNDDNKLVAEEAPEEEEDDRNADTGLGGAGKGYTRVQMDDDVESATSMDENTKYLFKDVGQNTSLTEDEEAQRDAVSQLQATKDLLTEGQRVAYVGLTRLVLSAMVKQAEERPGLKGRTKKDIQASAESMRMWSQKMMIRLYTHMEISPAEQVMIEQLSDHGVQPKDLTGLLMANARVKNPMAEDAKSSSGSGSKSPGLSSSPGEKDSRLSSSDAEPAHEGGGLEDEKEDDEAREEKEKDEEEEEEKEEEEEEEAPADPPPAYEATDGEELLEVRTPSQLPTTDKIDIDLRWTVLCDLFLVLIADSVYDARSRALLERVGQDIEITPLDICRFEKKVTDALEMQQNAEKENWNEDEHMESRRKLALRKRYMYMGLATVGGGLVIGLSAGLMAPLIGAGLAAGFTTIGVTGTGGFLAGAGGAAIITSGAAASGGIIGIKAANRRTGAVKTFEYRPLHNNKRVNLIVTVSGWMTGKVDDVRLPYSTVDPVMGDMYSVLWEPEMLTSMGDTINILATEALTQGLQQILGSTILVGLMAALQLPVVLTKLSYLIDNPWAVSLDRATAAGLILADSLIDRNLGTRPITLVGYSLGSRVIFSCLLELARKGAYGIVQNVYIFGSPLVVKSDEFLRARTVVSGRFVNGYHRNDWILGYLFRLTNGGIRRVAGLARIEDAGDLENMDVTDEVKGHMDYRTAMPRLLRKIGFLVESDEFSEIEDPDPENHQRRQRELISEIEEARRELERESLQQQQQQQQQKKQKKGFGAFFGRGKKKAAKKAEWEVYEGEQPASGGGGGGGGASDGALASGKTEDMEGNNHGVLFDVDAIRAELAREHALAADAEADDLILAQLQVRELQSTLPPMKLELSPSPTQTQQQQQQQQLPSPAPGLIVPPPNPLLRRSSRDASRDFLPPDGPAGLQPQLPHSRRSSYDLRHSGDRERSGASTTCRNVSVSHVPFYSTSPSPNTKGPSGSMTPDARHDGLDDEGEISMTFDTSFHHHDATTEDDRGYRPSPVAKQTSFETGLGIHHTAGTASETRRPEIARNAQTVPNITLADPWAEEGGEEEDADFGKEKEMELTFA